MQGELNEELKTLLRRFEESPESRLFAPLSDAYRKNGDIDRAIELCEEGLSRFPDYVSARVILGKCFYDKGASERAKTEFEKALDLDPENMVALKFLGDIHLAEDDRNKASSYYDKLLAIDPANKEIRKLHEEISNEFIPADIDLDDSENIESTEGAGEPATMTLAGIYAAQGYYAKAMNIYRDLISEDPDNKEAKEMLEKLRSMQKSSNEGRKEAFSDDVMTISLEDISDEMSESTAGSGGMDESLPDEELKSAQIEADNGEALDTADILEKEDFEERPREDEGEREDQKEKTASADLEEGEEEIKSDDLRNFMGWINKVKDKEDES